MSDLLQQVREAIAKGAVDTSTFSSAGAAIADRQYMLAAASLPLNTILDLLERLERMRPVVAAANAYRGCASGRNGYALDAALEALAPGDLKWATPTQETTREA